MSKYNGSDIIDILNAPSTRKDKITALYDVQKMHRGENRKIVYIVARLLNEHVLPMKFSKTLNLSFITDITEKQYGLLDNIVQSSKYEPFNAVANEVLWMHYHSISYARDAVIAYSALLSAAPLEDEVLQAQLSLSICRIYSKVKIKDFAYDSFFDKMICYIKSNYSSSGYCILFILTGLAECGNRLDEIKNTYEQAIQYYEANQNFEKAVSFLKSFEKISKKQKNADVSSIIKRIAVDYEKEADLLDWNDSSQALRIISLIHKAMNAWERTKAENSKQERQRLAKKITSVKKLSVEAMKTIDCGTVDVSEWSSVTEEFIKSSTLETVVYKLAHLFELKTIDDLKEEHNSPNRVFSSLFKQVVKDREGRITCVIPPAISAQGDDLIAILEHEASVHYSFIAHCYVQRYLWMCKKKFELTEESLAFLVENNAIIDEERRGSFLKGLVAGFNLDLSTAMYLLIPQVEHAIRNLARECGGVVYKTENNGVEKVLSLDSILSLPEVETSLDENFLFHLKLFYTSDYGFGMRGIVGHGLRSDNELQSSLSLAVWWFTLKMCCMFAPELEYTVYSQVKDAKNTKLELEKGEESEKEGHN